MESQNATIIKNISRLQLALRHLDRSLSRLAPVLSSPVSMNGRPKANARYRPRLSAQGRASLVLQGRYMGFMRQLKPRQKTQVRKMRETKGVRAAIARAKKLAEA